MNFRGGSGSGVMTWFIQRVTGAVLVAMVLFHFALMHFIQSSHEITYAWVAERFSDPLWKVFDETFLILALWHGFFGIKMVVDDYVRSNGWRIFWLAVLYTFAFFLFVMGTITVVSFQVPEVAAG
jgi:succinate dehydrogenase / fumarate reductase membrane anchor subunit